MVQILRPSAKKIAEGSGEYIRPLTDALIGYLEEKQENAELKKRGINLSGISDPKIRSMIIADALKKEESIGIEEFKRSESEKKKKDLMQSLSKVYDPNAPSRYQDLSLGEEAPFNRNNMRGQLSMGENQQEGPRNANTMRDQISMGENEREESPQNPLQQQFPQLSDEKLAKIPYEKLANLYLEDPKLAKFLYEQQRDAQKRIEDKRAQSEKMEYANKKAETASKSEIQKAQIAKEASFYNINEPKIIEILEKQRGSQTQRAQLGRLSKLFGETDKMPNQVMTSLFTTNGDINPTVYSNLSPQAQEAIGILQKLTSGIKDTYGSVISDFDLSTYTKGLPSLLASPEGRHRIIRDLRLINEINEIYYEGIQNIFEEKGGSHKASFSQVGREFNRKYGKKVEKKYNEYVENQEEEKGIEQGQEEGEIEKRAAKDKKYLDNSSKISRQEENEEENEEEILQPEENREIENLREREGIENENEPQTFLESQLSKIPGYLGTTARNVGRGGLRAAETIVGSPGDILSMINDWIKKPVSEKFSGLKSSAYEDLLILPYILPTSDTLKNISEKYIPGAKPHNEVEQFADDIAETAASIFSPGGALKKSASFGKNARFALLASLGANTLKHGAVQLSGDETKGELVKAGALVMTSFLNKKGAAKVISEAYDPLLKQLSKYRPIDAKRLKNLSTHLIKEMKKGTGAASEKFIIEECREILKKIKDGKIRPDELYAVKRSLNEKLSKVVYDNPKSAPRARKLAKSLAGEIKENLKFVEKIDPKLYKQLTAWDTAYAAMANSDFLTKWMGKYRSVVPITSGLLPLIGVSSHGAALGGAAAYQASKVGYRIAKSPELRKYYTKTTTAAVKENAKDFNRSLKKLDEAYQKKYGEKDKKSKEKKSVILNKRRPTKKFTLNPDEF